jgi:putative hydrolase of the HAD superfamily
VNTPRAILFDLDDTLNDRQSTLKVFADHFLKEFASKLEPISFDDLLLEYQRVDAGGYRPRDQVHAILAESLPWLEPVSAELLLAFWYDLFPKLSVPMPHARETLIALQARGITLGLVTNGKTKVQNEKVDALKLREFLDLILVSEHVGVKKPDPRIFEMALEHLQLEASQVWMVGDHPVNDVLGARGAGLTGVWFKGAMHAWPDDVERGLEIESLLELIGAVEYDVPTGLRFVPQHIIDGLVEDSKNLRKAAERIEVILSTPEGVQNARIDEREMHDLCETCLAAVINLFDVSYPTRPRVDLSIGYEFHSGPVGFITGGTQRAEKSVPYNLETDNLPE